MNYENIHSENHYCYNENYCHGCDGDRSGDGSGYVSYGDGDGDGDGEHDGDVDVGDDYNTSEDNWESQREDESRCMNYVEGTHSCPDHDDVNDEDFDDGDDHD